MIMIVIIIITIIIIKRGLQRKAGSDLQPINLKTPAPQYQPKDRKKIKGKPVKYKNG